MRIVCSYLGNEKAWEIDQDSFVFGRPHEGSPTTLDLSPDKKISRVHARVWRENGDCWVEDAQSTHGTRLNSEEIRGKGKKKLKVGDVLNIGDTSIRVESLEPDDPMTRTNYLAMGSAIKPDVLSSEPSVNIAQTRDATNLDPLPVVQISQSGAERLKLVCELPLLFATKTKLEDLLPTIVDRLVDVVSKADSWALVLRDLQSNELLLKAYRADSDPHLSDSLSRRAISERKAFIWNRAGGQDFSGTVLQSVFMTGIYAPLMWQDEALGVICAESRSPVQTFDEEDLRLVVFMAQYAAMAVGSHKLQERLREESLTSAKLKRQFSPKVAERLLKHRGNLRLGGERSTVTILNSDIRGFTKLSETMEPDEIVEMLNDYFAILVPIVFAHQGTIDKFIGDAILAVFGSPELDPKQYEHAVRAAVAMQSAIEAINLKRRSRGLPCASLGIGIHCGEVVHGLVGTSDRMEFTVIGDTVNKTSRYCSGAAAGEIVMSPAMHQRVWRIVQIEPKSIETSHGDIFDAYVIKGVKPEIFKEQAENKE